MEVVCECVLIEHNPIYVAQKFKLSWEKISRVKDCAIV